MHSSFLCNLVSSFVCLFVTQFFFSSFNFFFFVRGGVDRGNGKNGKNGKKQLRQNHASYKREVRLKAYSINSLNFFFSLDNFDEKVVARTIISCGVEFVLQVCCYNQLTSLIGCLLFCFIDCSFKKNLRRIFGSPRVPCAFHS